MRTDPSWRIKVGQCLSNTISLCNYSWFSTGLTGIDVMRSGVYFYWIRRTIFIGTKTKSYPHCSEHKTRKGDVRFAVDVTTLPTMNPPPHSQTKKKNQSVRESRKLSLLGGASIITSMFELTTNKRLFLLYCTITTWEPRVMSSYICRYRTFDLMRKKKMITDDPSTLHAYIGSRGWGGGNWRHGPLRDGRLVVVVSLEEIPM